MLPWRPDMLRMLDAARLTGATDMRREAAAIAISSWRTAANQTTTPNRTEITGISIGAD